MTRPTTTAITWKQNWPIFVGLGVFAISFICMFVDPIYGRMLYHSSPTTADPATGQVVHTVLSSKRGPSHYFYVTPVQWWLWTVLECLIWVPLIGCAAVWVWTWLSRPRWRS